MADRLVTVVIVTYWSQDTIVRCLDAVLASSTELEVIVVDNGSGDQTCARVRARADVEPRLRLLVNPDNPGFAAACNQAAALSTGDAVLFLNPDAFVAPDSISRLRAIVDADDQAGVVGCRVIDEGGRLCGPQRRREPTWRRSLVSAAGLARLERRWPSLQGVDAPAPLVAGAAAADIEAVDAVNGSVMLLPLAVFRSVGGFDEDFRLHAEDLDLCRRVRDAGYQVMYAASVTVTHIGGVSSRRRPLWVEWQKTRSLWRYFRKHDRAAGNPLVMALVAGGLGLRYLLRIPVLAMSRSRR